MILKKSSVTALIMGLLFAGSAGAGEPGTYYVKGAVGKAEADTSLSDYDGLNDGSITAADLDKEDTSFAISGGYWLNENLAVSLGYRDLGELSIDATSDGTGSRYAAGPVKLVTEVDGFTIGLDGQTPINEVWSLTGTLGVYFWDGEAELSDSSGSLLKVDDDDQDIYFGVGALAKVNNELSLGVEFQRFDIDGDDVDVFSANLQYAIPVQGRQRSVRSSRPAYTDPKPYAESPRNNTQGRKMVQSSDEPPRMNRYEPRGNMSAAAARDQ